MDDIEILEDLILLNQIYTSSRTRRGNKEFFKSRKKHGFYSTGVNIIVDKNPVLFFKSTRLNYSQFKTILNLTEPFLEKHSHRRPIGAEQRLYITLYFLAHGCSLHSLSMYFRIGHETARSVVLETCDILWSVLGGLYVSPPSLAEWEEISHHFYETTGLPNCIGAIDGKHIRLNSPHNTGSQYSNYKKFRSIVLLAVCDSNYRFTLVDVVNQSDGGVFRNSTFGKKFIDNELEIPHETYLPGSNTKFPYYLVGDAAFPLRENLMQPYALVTDSAVENYNKKISLARIRIEIAFGILTAQWKILRTTLSYSPINSKKIVLASIALHNYLRLNSSNSQATSAANTKSSSLRSINRELLQTSNALEQNALRNRNELCAYLNASII